jgi:diguanylate cyclase (GGDEF)-like protein
VTTHTHTQHRLVPPETTAEITVIHEAMQPEQLGSRRGLALLTGFVCLLAVLLWIPLVGDGSIHPVDYWQALAVAAAVAVTESSALHLEFRRQAFSMTLTEAPVVVGLCFLPPSLLLAARLLGAAVVFARRRSRPSVVAFNLPLFAVEMGVACTVFGFFDVSTTDPVSWLAAFLAVISYDLVSALGVVSAISVAQSRMRLGDLRSVLPMVAVSGLFGTTTGLIIVVVLTAQPLGAVLIGLMVVVSLLAFRAYATLSRRHDALNDVHAFTQLVAEAPDADALTRVLLRECVRLLNAEGATLRLLDTGMGERPSVLRMLANGEIVSWSPGLRPDDGVRPSVLFGAQSVLLSRSTHDPVRRQWLALEDVRDALLVPLPGNSGVLGCLEIVDRLGEVATFTEADVRLAETLAAAVAVALENARLVEKSLHDATHDPLTGLPNRTLFLARAAEHSGAGTAIMLFDLDRFQDVNEVLGHGSGDRVLCGVADLLRGIAPTDSVIGRVGGDEFAVLLPGIASSQEAQIRANALRIALLRPLELDGTTLEVAASIGVAISPQHGCEPELLVQRAAAALHHAKTAGPGSAQVWNTSMESANPRRLALVGDLRRALERDELVVHYQPKVVVETGEITGVEALVRWQHPSWGLLPPDEFIPMAEATGLIVPLTTYVLRSALKAASEWHTDGKRLGVAVNLSVRGLLDSDLPATVTQLLAATGMPAELLTLEITESHVMADVARTLPLLETLSSLGIGLSVDDFGTGYSSLAYLRRLPVKEIKIDKSFVAGLSGPRSEAMNDSAIVETIIGLARTLHLRVVAEGVEDMTAMNRLLEIGCDMAQGYLISRPIEVKQLTGWLAARQGRPWSSPGPVSLPGRPL